MIDVFIKKLYYKSIRTEKVFVQMEKRKFLGIYFDCCNVYGRVYKNKDGSAYEGRCPKCLRFVHVPVGEGGTSQRFFRAK